jgi:uncharacterized small protein (DUF1192 family)
MGYYSKKKKAQKVQNQQTNKNVDKKSELIEKVENVAGMLQNVDELKEVAQILIKEIKEIKAEKKATGKVSSRSIKDLVGLIGIAVAIFIGAANGEQVDTSAMIEASGIVTDTSATFLELKNDVSNISLQAEELLKTDSIYSKHLVFDSKGNLRLK